MKKKTHLVRNRILFSLIIIFVYYVCHRIPLNGIDLNYYKNVNMSLGALLTLVVNGSAQKCYVMSLGISPYITASLIVTIFYAFRSKEAKARTSPRSMNICIAVLTFVVTICESVFYATELKYVEESFWLFMIAALELMTGASIAQYLLISNQKYGVGGFLPLIIVNMSETLVGTFFKTSFSNLIIPLSISFIMVIIMIYMELHEKRIPLQRVTVHNIHANKNYLAIKYNPVGFMAIMFGSAIFMIPQFVIGILHYFIKSPTLNWLYDNFKMSTPFGIIIYIILMFLFSIFLSLLFVNPKELSDKLLEGGDSIVGIHAGKPTRRYIRKWVLLLSCVSATIMCTCFAVCLYLQYKGIVPANVAMLPSTFMMLSGLACALYLEIKAYYDFDSYKPFI